MCLSTLSRNLFIVNILKVYKRSLYFKGRSVVEDKVFELKIRLLKEILPERAKYQVRPRGIEIALEKVKEGPYWERLLEEKTKQHWLKIDFEKWKDEDDSEEETETDRFEDRMKEMDSLVKISNKAFGTNVEKDAVDNKEEEGLDDVMKGLSPFSSMMMFEDEGEEKMRRLCRVQQKISKKPQPIL